MAKASVEVNKATVAEKLRKEPLPKVIGWALEHGGGSLFGEQIKALESQRDKGDLSGTAKQRVMDAIDSLTEADTAANEPLYRLIADAIREVAGRSVPLAADNGRATSTGGGGDGTGTRLKRADKERLVEEAARLIAGAADGMSRSQVAEKLGVEKGTAGTVLKALRDAKRIKVQGDKAAARYFAA
jgi:hypothetical protein